MLFKIETEKSIEEVIEGIRNKAHDFNFIVRDIFDMAEDFKNHGVDVEPGFKYYSATICNPRKAYESIKADPIRGALLFPPKQVVIYSENEKTILAYVSPEKEDLARIVPKDEKLQEGLSASGEKIIEFMKNVV